MNAENLQPFAKGESRAVEAGRKGGVASGVARRERMRALLLAELDAQAMTLSAPHSDDPFSLENFYAKATVVPAGYSRRAAIVKELVNMAERGDIKAIKLVFDLAEGDDDPTLEA